MASMFELAARIEARTTSLGHPVSLDPLAVLVERAAIAGFTRAGRTSCGGATRLLRTGDGWIALSLARPDDVDLLPAWLGVEPGRDDGETWTLVERAVESRPARDLVAVGSSLGLPIAELGECSNGDPLVAAADIGAAPVTPTLHAVRVVDLTSLWAGPLCGSILADAGADVVKVESSSRPDSARVGAPEFFDLMNAGKRSVVLDFSTTGGRSELETLVESADVVLAGSRPRALAQLGLDDPVAIAGRGPRVWLSLTGHGLDATARDRVGFGDDAAVAGGLVAWDDDQPYFCADAIADPLSGMVAADAVLGALTDGGRWHLDVALARVAAAFAGPTMPVSAGAGAPPPVATRARGAARRLGADNSTVLARPDENV